MTERRRIVGAVAVGLMAWLGLPHGVGAESTATSTLPPAAVSSFPPVPWTEALEQASHPSDFTRILAEGPPELWGAAAGGLLGEDDEVSGLALSVVLRRLGALGPEMRFRVSAALVRDSHDPRVLR